MHTEKVLKRQFVQLEDPTSLLQILHSRLPWSAHMYNNAQLFKAWSDISTWWVLDGQIDQNSWLILIMKCPYSEEISISRPPDSKITPEITEAFASHPSIHWDGESTGIFAVDPGCSEMVSGICSLVKGRPVSINPCLFYHMDPDTALQLDDTCHLTHDDGLKIKSMDNELGRAFLPSTWKYGTGPGIFDYVDKTLSRNPSAGIFLKGQLIAGVVQARYGRIGMLYTLVEHRGKGYGKFCMHFLMKKIATLGLVPNCMVEMDNLASQAFQTKIGFKLIGRTNVVLSQ